MLQLWSQILPPVIPCNSHEGKKLSAAEPGVRPPESLLTAAKQDPRRIQFDFQARGWVYLGSTARAQSWMLYYKEQGQVYQWGWHCTQLCRVGTYCSREGFKQSFPRSIYMFSYMFTYVYRYFYSPFWKYNLYIQLFLFPSVYKV